MNMLEKSPLKIKKPDQDAQIGFLFEVAGAPQKPKIPIPLYWQVGVANPTQNIIDLTKRQIARNRALQSKYLATQQLLKQYEKQLALQQAEYAADAERREALYRKKEEEIEQIHKNTNLLHEAELLKKQEELRRLEQENNARDAELENTKRLIELRQRHESIESELLDQLSDADTAITAKTRKAEEIDAALEQVKAEFLDMNRAEIRQRQANDKRVFEEYDQKNIMEIKEVYFLNRLRERYALYLPTMSVKRGKITVITSGNADVLELAFKALFRAYGADYSIRQGEVRINGVATTTVLRQDFKKTFGDTANTVYDFRDAVSGEKQTAKKAFGKGAESDLKRALSALGENSELSRTPFQKLTASEKELLALAVAISSKEPLTGLLQPFRPGDRDFNERLIALLESRPAGKTFLVLTSDTESVLRFSDCNLYRLE